MLATSIKEAVIVSNFFWKASGVEVTQYGCVTARVTEVGRKGHCIWLTKGWVFNPFQLACWYSMNQDV